MICRATGPLPARPEEHSNSHLKIPAEERIQTVEKDSFPVQLLAIAHGHCFLQIVIARFAQESHQFRRFVVRIERHLTRVKISAVARILGEHRIEILDKNGSRFSKKVMDTHSVEVSRILLKDVMHRSNLKRQACLERTDRSVGYSLVARPCG